MTPEENPLVQLAAAYAALEEAVGTMLAARLGRPGKTRLERDVSAAHERIQRLKGAAVEAQRAAS